MGHEDEQWRIDGVLEDASHPTRDIGIPPYKIFDYPLYETWHDQAKRTFKGFIRQLPYVMPQTQHWAAWQVSLARRDNRLRTSRETAPPVFREDGRILFLLRENEVY